MLCGAVVQSTIPNDAYHFADYQDSPAVADYLEWWYFSFSQDNIQGIVQYSLWDPLDLSPRSFGAVAVNLYMPSGTVETFYLAPWEQVVTSETSANLIVGPDTITVDENGVYTLQGVAGNLEGDVVMYNLQYIPTSAPIEGIRNLKLSPLDPTQEMNWYGAIPSAMVVGAVIVNGQTIPVNAKGYHDHNWGTWKLYNSLWNWFQANDENIAIICYDFFTLRKGQLTVVADGKTINFKRWQYRIINYDWTLDPETYQLYPKKAIIIAFNRRYILWLKITVDQTTVIGAPYEEDGLAWLVYESTASFKGKLCGRDVNLNIDMQGFKEYTVVIPLPPQ